MKIVDGCGPTPAHVMLVGEAPGREEANRGRPFVGASGREQQWYLRHHGLNVADFYRTNVVKEYREGNPDPTPAQIAEWSPVLEAEIAICRPRVIVAVGRFATQWFLGDWATMQMTHGLIHRSDKAPNAVVVPVHHPAMGLHNASTDTRATIAYDYSRAADIIGLGGVPIKYIPKDVCEGAETYTDALGHGLDSYLRYNPFILAIDTEGYVDDPWSIQVSCNPGEGVVMRYSQPDFQHGISAIQRCIDAGARIIFHNALYDIPMCRAMGLEMAHADIWDSQYAAYLTRTEPQGLKALAWRHGRMRMSSYAETVSASGLEKQIGYLWMVLLEHDEGTWPKPQPEAILANDGTSKLYRPRAVGLGAKSILNDYYAEKVDKDGARTNPRARWLKIPRHIRAPVEAELGPMPKHSLEYVPRDVAIHYAARDADATFRVAAALDALLESRGLTTLMDDGMKVLPILEEIQATGMPGNADAFTALAADMTQDMVRIQGLISSKYYCDKPINPRSDDQVRSLLRRRGLKAEKWTKTGKVSTAKPSIEHLRYSDPAIAMVFDWRERQHTRDTFCTPILNRLPIDAEGIHTVYCQVKATRTATRRLAVANPNFLAVTTHSDHGRRVKDCYVCPPGQVFAAWDLSQIEMRVMADESQDTMLVDGFRQGLDIHSETAAAIFEIPLAKVDKSDHRVPAKRAGFGIIYGMTGRGLLAQLWMLGLTTWTVARCNDLIERWLEVHSGVAAYMKRTAEEVRKSPTNCVRDRWGMPRYLPGIRHPDRGIRAECERIAVSHRIQGGAQGMIQNSMAWLRPYIAELQSAGADIKWSLQIHDELLFRCSEEWVEVLDPLVTEALTQHHGTELVVPVAADSAVSNTWGGLKD